MADSRSIKAFKDKLKYSELVSSVWGSVISVLFLTALMKLCIKGNGVYLLASCALCRLSVARENKTQVYFSSQFYDLYKKHLFDSYLGLACVALLKSVYLHPG